MHNAARFGLPLLVLFAQAGCTDDAATGPAVSRPELTVRADEAELASSVRALAASRSVTPLPRPPQVRAALVELGRALMFDPLLSGNRDISCMTCHAPSFATGDGRSLSLGQGAVGLGPGRIHPEGSFIPRNAPPLFNLHTLEVFFWDGRVRQDRHGTVRTGGAQLPPGMQRVFEFGALSAVGLLPVISREEMRGFSGNELAAIPDGQPQRVWRVLMRRLGDVAEYRDLFEAAYPSTPFTAATFAHASNAMAGFLISQLTFDDSPWDRFLAGHDGALSRPQLEGARVFMEIRCSICHGGPAFTDGEFHNVALAQFGPGMGDGPEGNDDFGHGRVSGERAHRYAFRTTPLRNVSLTAPYGHAGQFADLRAFIDHYSESHLKLTDYDAAQLEPLLRGTLVDNAAAILATRDTILEGVVLPREVVDALVTYMTALTDPAARDLSHLVPATVPSGLPIMAAER